MITKEKFQTYLEIQHSGLTNMFDLKKVIDLSEGNLDKEDCMNIMKNYAEYTGKWSE